jgi:signal transduction histidine kinase
VTERHRKNADVRHELPSALIHELRTPLNQIIGYSDLLKEQAEEAGYDVLLPDLAKVGAAGQLLLAVINDNFNSVGRTNAPAAPAAVAQTTSPQEPRVESATAKAHGSLLVVDDSEANRDVLSRRLESQGYAVATAEGGQQALQMLEAATFDLVLLDIMMPGMDGYEVLRTLKGDQRLRHIPVIMISALDELDSVVRCIELGAEDHLAKPFSPTLLKARIGACLDKKRAHDRETELFEELQRNYARLQELERLRDDLTRMIIHDLRTPLTSLMVGMQSVESAGDLNSDQKEMMDIAVTGGETLLAMINDLLDVEKLESGSMQLDYGDLSAIDLVDSALSQVSALAEGKGLKIVRTLRPGLPTFRGDENKLRRTLVNLLGNAIKFTPGGGTVTIEVRDADNGESLIFSVMDTGEGIPREAFGRIFEKFGQVESREGGRVVGTGLGLTFCKLTVEAHGGEISVESTPGKGSTFSFKIPIFVPLQDPRSALSAT